MNPLIFNSYGQSWQTTASHTRQDQQLSVHTPAGQSPYSEVVIPPQQQYMLPPIPEDEDDERDNCTHPMGRRQWQASPVSSAEPATYDWAQAEPPSFDIEADLREAFELTVYGRKRRHDEQTESPKVFGRKFDAPVRPQPQAQPAGVTSNSALSEKIHAFLCWAISNPKAAIENPVDITLGQCLEYLRQMQAPDESRPILACIILARLAYHGRTSDAPWSNEEKFCDRLRPFLPEQWRLEQGMFATQLRTLLGNCPHVLQMLDELGYGKWPALFPLLPKWECTQDKVDLAIRHWVRTSVDAKSAILKEDPAFTSSVLVSYLDRIDAKQYPERKRFASCLVLARLALHGSQGLNTSLLSVWNTSIKEWLPDQWFDELGVSVEEVRSLILSKTSRQTYKLMLTDFEKKYPSPGSSQLDAPLPPLLQPPAQSQPAGVTSNMTLPQEIHAFLCWAISNPKGAIHKRADITLGQFLDYLRHMQADDKFRPTVACIILARLAYHGRSGDAPWRNEGKFCDTLRPFLSEQWPLERGMFATRLRTLLGNCPQVLNMLDQLGYGKWPALFPLIPGLVGSPTYRKIKRWVENSPTAKDAIRAKTEFCLSGLVTYLNRINGKTHPEGKRFVTCVVLARLAVHGTEGGLGDSIYSVWQQSIMPWLPHQLFPQLGMSVEEVQDLLSRRTEPYQRVLDELRTLF